MVTKVVMLDKKKVEVKMIVVTMIEIAEENAKSLQRTTVMMTATEGGTGHHVIESTVMMTGIERRKSHHTKENSVTMIVPTKGNEEGKSRHVVDRTMMMIVTTKGNEERKSHRVTCVIENVIEARKEIVPVLTNLIVETDMTEKKADKIRAQAITKSI